MMSLALVGSRRWSGPQELAGMAHKLLVMAGIEVAWSQSGLPQESTGCGGLSVARQAILHPSNALYAKPLREDCFKLKTFWRAPLWIKYELPVIRLAEFGSRLTTASG
jgi:hypothetical protein